MQGPLNAEVALQCETEDLQVYLGEGDPRSALIE